jgi:hypothetical protein
VRAVCVADLTTLSAPYSNNAQALHGSQTTGPMWLKLIDIWLRASFKVAVTKVNKINQLIKYHAKK